jgi:hypothetical protein
MLKRYYYWVAASRNDNESVGDTGHISASSARQAADQRAAELRLIPDCAGQMVYARSDDALDPLCPVHETAAAQV